MFGRERSPLSTLSAADRTVAVLGLGRFGTTLALTLAEEGAEVLAVDRTESVVAGVKESIPRAAIADTTDPDVLSDLGLAEFGHVVVAIGADLEASVLTTSATVDLGIGDIWAKAITRRQGTILERIGAHHVVYPEIDTGRRLAHVVTGHLLEYAPLGDDFAVARTAVPRSLVGREWDAARLSGRHEVSIGWVWRGGAFLDPSVGLRFQDGDELVVGGDARSVTSFTSLD